MPPATENEPHNIFNEDLFQNTSFIDLLQNSPDVNICYMSDEEPLGLPPMLPSTTELSLAGSSVSVLEMINQEGMLGSFQSTSNASTEVTYVAQGTAPSVAPFTTAGDVFSLNVPSTTSTIAKLLHAPIKTFKSNLRPSTNLRPITSTNPFMVNPFISKERELVRNPLVGTRIAEERDRSTCKNSSSSKKSKCRRSHSSHKSSSHSRLRKKTSHSCSKLQNILAGGSSHKSHVLKAVCSDLKTIVTHSVTRTRNTVSENTVAFTTVSVTHTTTVTHAINQCTVTGAQTTVSSVGTAGIVAITSSECTSMITSYTVTRARAPSSIISPMQSTYIPAKVLYSTPTIISRSAPAADRICEQFAILPTQTAFTIPTGGESTIESDAPRARTRLVIPMSLNAFATSAASIVTTPASKNRVQNASTHIATPSTNTSTVVSRTLGHNSFALPPGATLIAARKLTNRLSSAVTTEPHTFAIVDGKGTYTTLTIASDFTTTTTTSAPLIMTPTQNTTAATAGDSTSSVAADSPARPRSQLLIPIANTQMNTSTSLGYLVTSPIGSSIITTRGTTATSSTLNAATTTTSVASHTITTISTAALNRIRNRLIYNIPSTTGISLPSTTSGDNRPRGPVTIITNQLISGANTHGGASTSVPSAAAAPRAMFSAGSQGLYAIATPATTVSATSSAEPATRALNRVVIPINVHATSPSVHTVSTQGAYIIAGMSSSTTSDAMTRPSRVVIPIIHNASTTTVTSTSTVTKTASRCCSSSIAPTDAHSKLRSRLTIQVGTTESSMPGTTTPVTAYTITRTRAPQSVYAIPTGSGSPYITTKSSDCSRSPATMTLITFTPPSTGGAGGVTQKTSHREVPSTVSSLTSATPTLASTGNRFVIKLAGPSSTSGGTSVTTAITTPITSTSFSSMGHRFTEPQPVPARLRNFPAPRTYSISQRSVAGVAANALQRNINQCVKKPVANPSPLQIFADVVSPPTTTAPTPSCSNSRFTLSHSPGSSTLIVPRYKNTVFKNLSTVAHPNPVRNGSRTLGPRVSSERLVLNRSVALVTPRRPAPGGGAREPRAPHADSTPPATRASPAPSGSTPPSDSQSSSNQDDQND